MCFNTVEGPSRARNVVTHGSLEPSEYRLSVSVVWYLCLYQLSGTFLTLLLSDIQELLNSWYTEHDEMMVGLVAFSSYAQELPRNEYMKY